MDRERIETPCPSCGSRTLFVGIGGHLTCSLIGCKEPVVERAFAAETARADREAAARQEAEQKLGEAEGWLAFHKTTKEAAYGANLNLIRERRELTAERDRLSAKLAALRGKDASA